MNYVYLLGGLIALIASGNFLVKGGVSLASHFKISTLVIGVTVVSFGTSAPELLVSLKAAISGHPDIAIGNVIGSNISNIALVLALTAVIMPIVVNRSSLKFDWTVMMAISLLFLIFIINEEGFSLTSTNTLQRWEGIILFILLLIYITGSVMKSRKAQKKNPEVIKEPEYKLPVSIIMVSGSCVGLVFGADWLVKGASGIASSFGISDRVISVTVVAFGTSVPELVTSVMAAIKKEMDISVGNIIGSNIFNILAILGLTSIVHPIEINPQVVNFDIYWVLGISLALLLCMTPFKKPIIGRLKGMILILGYTVYIYLVFLRGS